jgi:L,D-transpeptidase YbiS
MENCLINKAISNPFTGRSGMRKRVTSYFLAAVAFSLLMGASCPKQKDQIEQAPKFGARELYMEGEKSFEIGDYESAQEIYQKVLELYPTSGWSNKAQFRIGQCYLKTGNSEEALEEFRRYVGNNRDGADVDTAKDYIIKILENLYQETVTEYEVNLKGMEQQNFRLEMLNKYLRKSVDSEVIYLELDLEGNRLFVKLGTQALYDYPIVSGKGRRRLQGNGRTKNFSTPKGIRQVEYIEKNPVWYKPDWVWYERGEELPEEITMEDRAVPGVLGPYKVSFGEGYFIHGTRRGTIRPGKYSHGCVRMNNKDLKQMVRLVDVGTAIYIY